MKRIAILLFLFLSTTVNCTENFIGIGLGDPVGLNVIYGKFWGKFGFQFAGCVFESDTYGLRGNLNCKLFESDFNDNVEVSEKEDDIKIYSSWLSITSGKTKFGDALEENYLGAGINVRLMIFLFEAGGRINYAGYGYEDAHPFVKYSYFQMGAVMPF